MNVSSLVAMMSVSVTSAAVRDIALSPARYVELEERFLFTFDRNGDGVVTHSEASAGILAIGQKPTPLNPV